VRPLGVLAVIPYTTFPTIALGPLELRTFGFVVAIGVLLGSWLAARYGEEHGVPRDTTYSLAMRMVVAGVIGSRITWVLTHMDDLDAPWEVFAIWHGGLQFSGGFVFAVIAGYPVYRHWNRLTRWHSLDGYAYGLAVGLGIGRIACYAVGEHFGRLTSFPLAVRYDGGDVREPFLGDVRLEEGMVFHHTALYELLYMLGIFLLLSWLLHRRTPRPGPGTAMGLFCLAYGVCRFLSDTLRVNDERVLGMTGAQYLSIALVLTGGWVLIRVRPILQRDIASGMPVGLPGASDDDADGPSVEGGEAAQRA
jgi:phosphatidylglycerol---prolipoprotein diacylglyceryl transferase